MKITSLPPDDSYSLRLYEELDAFSAAAGFNTRKRKSEAPFLFVLKDEAGAFQGGAQGAVYGGWLDVYSLYSTRTVKGVGTRLMDHVEDYARQQGCKGVKLVTFKFQAPGFYEKRGYSIYGEVEDLVEGYANIYMKKIL